VVVTVFETVFDTVFDTVDFFCQRNPPLLDVHRYVVLPTFLVMPTARHVLPARSAVGGEATATAAGVAEAWVGATAAGDAAASATLSGRLVAAGCSAG
jgi:hypothetical protein